MAQDNKMMDTSKKVPAPRLDKTKLSSTVIELSLHMQRIKPEHLERKFLRTKVISLMSSTGFKVSRVSELFPTKG